MRLVIRIVVRRKGRGGFMGVFGLCRSLDWWLWPARLDGICGMRIMRKAASDLSNGEVLGLEHESGWSSGCGIRIG